MDEKWNHWNRIFWKVTILNNCSFQKILRTNFPFLFPIYIYIKQEKLNFIEQLANRNASIHETKILSMQTKKISYSSSFFTFKISAKRERRNIHKSDISRSQNGGKGPSITTTLELIRSRKLVTYLYLDTQSASPFSPSLFPSFFPSFLFVDHGRD